MITMFPKADIIEQFLKGDIVINNTWMTENKVISTVADHFSRLRWPENPSGININVKLALADWKAQCKKEQGETYVSGISDFRMEIMADFITISLKRFPQDLLVQTAD